MMNQTKEKWEKEIDTIFAESEASGQVPFESEGLKSFIRSRFISREKAEEILKKGHGGGNWRRLILELLGKEEEK